jgi:hypothetical protein
VAAQGFGLYEDNNPIPIATAMTGASASDLNAALAALNAAGTTAPYGSYTVKLGKQPDLPPHFTLGSGSGEGTYPAIGSIDVIIEGLGDGIKLWPVDDLWTLDRGNSLSYGKGVTVKVMTWTTLVYNTGGRTLQTTKSWTCTTTPPGWSPHLRCGLGA